MGYVEKAIARPPLTVGRLFIDPSGPTVTWKGHEVRLTYTELAILYALALRAGRVLTRENLFEAANLNIDSYVYERSIDSHVKRVRNKFKAVDPDFSKIETIYNMGYRLRHPGVTVVGATPSSEDLPES